MGFVSLLKATDLSFIVIEKSSTVNYYSLCVVLLILLVMLILLLLRQDRIDLFKLDCLLSSMLNAIGGLILTGS